MYASYGISDGISKVGIIIPLIVLILLYLSTFRIVNYTKIL